jgi:hypothetical protein
MCRDGNHIDFHFASTNQWDSTNAINTLICTGREYPLG